MRGNGAKMREGEKETQEREGKCNTAGRTRSKSLRREGTDRQEKVRDKKHMKSEHSCL